MKRILIIVFSLLGFTVSAQTIYVLKDSDGSALLTAREPTEDSYKHLIIERKTYYPEWSPLDWNSSCSKDKFNGTKVCSLSKAHSDVMVSIINGRYSVYVGENHYPKTQSAIKIDNNSPIYGDEGSSRTPQKVIEQMKKGKVAYTRYKKWPYEYNQDGEVDLTGFKEKFEQMKEEYKRL